MQKKCILLIKTACCYSKKSTLFLPKMRTVSENILHFEHVTYLKEVEILAKTPEKLLRDAFSNIRKDIEGNKYKALIGEGKGYNPLGADSEYQRLYIKTFDEQLKKAIGEDNALFETKAYKDAMAMHVGDYGKGVIWVHKKLKSALLSADLKLYENCRHEILNDSCREEVLYDILNFVKE